MPNLSLIKIHLIVIMFCYLSFPHGVLVSVQLGEIVEVVKGRIQSIMKTELRSLFPWHIKHFTFSQFKVLENYLIKQMTKNVKSKLYHIEISKTRGQTV